MIKTGIRNLLLEPLPTRLGRLIIKSKKQKILSFISVIVVPLSKEKSCLPSKRMNIGEVETIAKSLPQHR